MRSITAGNDERMSGFRNGGSIPPGRKNGFLAKNKRPPALKTIYLYGVSSCERGGDKMAQWNNATKVEKALNAILIARGNDPVNDYPLFDLAADYGNLWRVKDMLLQDIAERGVQVRWQNGENSFGLKKNDSVDSLVKTNAQMLKILNYLKVEPSDIVEDQEEDETDDGL